MKNDKKRGKSGSEKKMDQTACRSKNLKQANGQMRGIKVFGSNTISTHPNIRGQGKISVNVHQNM
jgi:hypothetical protein